MLICYGTQEFLRETAVDSVSQKRWLENKHVLPQDFSDFCQDIAWAVQIAKKSLRELRDKPYDITYKECTVAGSNNYGLAFYANNKGIEVMIDQDFHKKDGWSLYNLGSPEVPSASKTDFRVHTKKNILFSVLKELVRAKQVTKDEAEQIMNFGIGECEKNPASIKGLDSFVLHASYGLPLSTKWYDGFEHAFKPKEFSLFVHDFSWGIKTALHQLGITNIDIWVIKGSLEEHLASEHDRMLTVKIFNEGSVGLILNPYSKQLKYELPYSAPAHYSVKLELPDGLVNASITARTMTKIKLSVALKEELHRLNMITDEEVMCGNDKIILDAIKSSGQGPVHGFN